MNDYREDQYIEKKRITSLKEVVNDQGKVSQALESRFITYQLNLANTQGMKQMKYNNLSDIGEKVIHSNLDAKMFFYIIRNQGSNSMLKKTYGKDLANTTYIAKYFKVTPQKVRGFIRKCIEADLLKKLKTNFIVNPYIIVPYHSTNNDLHQLQLWFDENPDYILEIKEPIDVDKFEKESIEKIYEKILKD